MQRGILDDASSEKTIRKDDVSVDTSMEIK